MRHEALTSEQIPFAGGESSSPKSGSLTTKSEWEESEWTQLGASHNRYIFKNDRSVCFGDNQNTRMIYELVHTNSYLSSLEKT